MIFYNCVRLILFGFPLHNPPFAACTKLLKVHHEHKAQSDYSRKIQQCQEHLLTNKQKMQKYIQKIHKNKQQSH